MNNHLLDFLREVSSQLSMSDEPLSPATLDALEASKESLQAMHGRYQAEAPPGAEEVRECMLEALTLFFCCIELLEEVNEGADAELLVQAVEKAEEASDLLEQIEYLVSQIQQDSDNG